MFLACGFACASYRSRAIVAQLTRDSAHGRTASERDHPRAAGGASRVHSAAGPLGRDRTGETSVSSAACGAAVDRSRNYEDNMQTAKPFSCAECGAVFRRLDVLKNHLRTHTGEKPFSSAECGAALSPSVNLRTRMGTQEGEKPFSCAECGVEFSRLDNLKRHHRIHADVCDGVVDVATSGGHVPSLRPAHERCTRDSSCR